MEMKNDTELLPLIEVIVASHGKNSNSNNNNYDDEASSMMAGTTTTRRRSPKSLLWMGFIATAAVSGTAYWKLLCVPSVSLLLLRNQNQNDQVSVLNTDAVTGTTTLTTTVDPTPLRIACAGDSITYGYGLFQRAKLAYPSVLQEVLGSQYEVRNFGHSGKTMVRGGSESYWDTTEYQQALASSPDVVIIMLGTNDAQFKNRQWFQDDFVTDVAALIQSFQDLSSEPRVFLAQPPPDYSGFLGFFFNATQINIQYSTLFPALASENKVPLIDVFGALGGSSLDTPGLMSWDGIHPNKNGYHAIAEKVFTAVQEVQ